MNIVVMGAGAIGSLFGAHLSKENQVILIGKAKHITKINKNGLKITGKTNMTVNIKARETPDKIIEDGPPDIILLTVKSYDTERAVREIRPIMADKTLIFSLQNGLDNIEKISKRVDKKKIIAGITTHGAYFVKPGVIQHTGIGKTILGELDGRITRRIQKFVSVFEKANIASRISKNIQNELWIKAIINSSINPITSILNCKNGQLLRHPLLNNLVEKICRESTAVARGEGLELDDNVLIEMTKNIIQTTAENYSSMLQSIQRGKKTEIDSINGKIIEFGKKWGVPTPLNEILVSLVKTLE